MNRNQIANLKEKLLKNRDEWKFVTPFGWDKSNVVSRDSETGDVITRENRLYLGFNAKHIPLTSQEKRILKSGLDESSYSHNKIVDTVQIGDKTHRPPIAFEVADSKSIWTSQDRDRMEKNKGDILSNFLDQWERNALLKLPRVELQAPDVSERLDGQKLSPRSNKLR